MAATGARRLQATLTGKRRVLWAGQHGFGWGEKTGVVIRAYPRLDRGRFGDAGGRLLFGPS